MRVLGLAGYQHTGKDTIAAHLVARHGFTRVGFADALKDEVYHRFPRLLEQLWLRSGHTSVERMMEDKDATIRALLQEYGTEVRRKDDPNYWIREWHRRTAPLAGPLVIPDVRFVNEVQFINGSSTVTGKVIRVYRRGFGPVGNHESETALPDNSLMYDTRLLNNGTIADLYRLVDQTLDEWGWSS